MVKPLNVAILGATGAVGQELLNLLDEREFPVDRLTLLASSRSAGQTVSFQGSTLTIEAVSEASFAQVDLVLASAGSSVSREWAPVATHQGAVVVDNSSAFRMDPLVPLVVPEVNPEAAFEHQGIIANPNCTTILMCVAIYPLHKVNPIQRIVAATYQSASGAGASAMMELEDQSRDVLAGKPPEPKVFPFPIAFNLFPHNSSIQDNHYCQEELKMLNESRKIMGAPELRLSATCVRVPVHRAHAETLNLEFQDPFDVDKARHLISEAPGVRILEDWSANRFPMPIDVSGQNEVAVGRIRQDISHTHCLELWICGDQIRKGAALNAIQIAELLLAEGKLPAC